MAQGRPPLSNFLVFSIFSVLSIFIRLPFFFRDYIDRDESTFILMGQAWVDGFLPYTELWDVKPPLTFLFFAALIYTFGKSFLAIRLAGALLVAVTAYCTYALGVKLGDRRVGLVTGIVCIVLLSMFGSIQGVMSEHILMAFFMAALCGIVFSRKWYHYPLAGLALGVGLMVKINLAFSVVFIGIYLFYRHFRTSGLSKSLLRLSQLAFPAALVVLLTFLPYYFKGIPGVWWDSVVLAPLAYSEAGSGNLTGIYILCFAVLALVAWGRFSGRLDFGKIGVWVLVAGMLGILVSFIKAGRLNTHYLIQLYPLLLVVTGLLLRPEINRMGKTALRWALVILVLLPVETYLEYRNIVRHKFRTGSFFNGEGFTVSAYLKANGLDRKSTLFLEYHIGYWVLGTYPPVKSATHPSNICKEEMFPFYNPERETALEELRHIMEGVRPEVVVTRANRSIFDGRKKRENQYIDSVLKVDYKPAVEVEEAAVYSRLE